MTDNTSRSAWGVDGCKAGWFWFRLPISPAGQVSWGVVATLRSLFDTKETAKKVGERDLMLVDIPIGLPKEGPKESDFRKCDLESREVLGERKSSVFPVPRRAVLEGLLRELKFDHVGDAHRPKTWKWQKVRPALDRRGLSVPEGEGRITAQSFAILAKVAEVDDLLRRRETAKLIVRETHPEVCFWALNRKAPMRFAKKHGLGFLDRVCRLDGHRPGSKDAIFQACKEHPGVRSDDIVDAMACAVTAWIVLDDKDKARALPAREDVADRSSSPEIVYAVPPARKPNAGRSGSQ